MDQETTIAPRSNKSDTTPPAAADKQLPNPWLFDTQELINALDKIRETILRIPNATHEVHLRTLSAIDGVWRLREHLRELLATAPRNATQFCSTRFRPAKPNEPARKAASIVRTNRGVFTIHTGVGRDPLAGRPFPLGQPFH